MTLKSILTRNEADVVPIRWEVALRECAQNPMWAAAERTLLFRYASHILPIADQNADSLYPHHVRFMGTPRECTLYYIGYWSGRLRDLRRRFITTGEYSPRAWGLLKIPLAVLEEKAGGELSTYAPLVTREKGGNRYVLHLG